MIEVVTLEVVLKLVHMIVRQFAQAIENKLKVELNSEVVRVDRKVVGTEFEVCPVLEQLLEGSGYS